MKRLGLSPVAGADTMARVWSAAPLEPWLEELRAGNVIDQTLPSF